MTAKVGHSIEVIIDRVDGEGAVGRSQWDAPEIDGSVFLESATNLRPGDIVRARVARAEDYDLWAVPLVRGCGRVARAPAERRRREDIPR
jgi:ribosomal protein S12 methylthiotransferase